MAEGIVVALLATPEFVSAEQHGRAVREQQRREQRALDALAPREDLRVVRGSFGAPVVAMVVVDAALIALAVGLIVLMVVTDQVPPA